MLVLFRHIYFKMSCSPTIALIPTEFRCYVVSALYPSGVVHLRHTVFQSNVTSEQCPIGTVSRDIQMASSLVNIQVYLFATTSCIPTTVLPRQTYLNSFRNKALLNNHTT